MDKLETYSVPTGVHRYLMISVKILAHSEHPTGDSELITYEMTYPRLIHAELMTHRAFSRNASSSRAIPIKKMIRDVWNNVAWPERWGSNGRGMQDHGLLTGWRLSAIRGLWKLASRAACVTAWTLEKLGLHKQLANRILEPFGHITVVVTPERAGLFNFFGLRAHPEAQPEFQVLAYRALRAYLLSIPDRLSYGQWHAPMTDDLPVEMSTEDKLRIATGRIARVSYLTHEGTRDTAADIELHDRLALSGHWSPFEHCARPVEAKIPFMNEGGNFGPYWAQYRKQFPNELRKPTRAELVTTLVERPAWFQL